MHDRIKVLARIRPLNSKEISRNDEMAISSKGQCIQVESHSGSSYGRKFILDAVLTEEASQEEVFESIIPLLESSVQGYNCTVFTYGQTGTGKTFTMLGYDLWEMATDSACMEKSLTDISRDSMYMGIVPRSMQWLFGNLNKMGGSFSISVSYVELYNDIKIIDLLDSQDANKNLEIRENKKGEIVVPGLTRVSVTTVDEVLQVLWDGAKCRSVAATDMNDHSSRSHTVFIVYMLIESGRELRRSKICLVDLAGSEKWKSHQMATFSEARIKELTSINRSLSALGNCISALLKPSRAHIPYRDSKLTRLLQDSLGGNTQTLFIVTISPSISCIEETTSTLQFADRAMKVQVVASANTVSTYGSSGAEIERCQQEITRLKSLLQVVLQKCGGSIDLSSLAKEIGTLGSSSSNENPASSQTRDNMDFDACVSEELVHLKEENSRLMKGLYSSQEEARILREEKRAILAAVFEDDEFSVDIDHSPSGEVLSARLALVDEQCDSFDAKSRLQCRVLKAQREELDRRKEEMDEADALQEERWMWLQQYHSWLQTQSTPLTADYSAKNGINEDIYHRVCLMEASVLLQADELQRTKKIFLKTNTQLQHDLSASSEMIDQLKDQHREDVAKIKKLEKELENSTLYSARSGDIEASKSSKSNNNSIKANVRGEMTKPSSNKPPEPRLPPPSNTKRKNVIRTKSSSNDSEMDVNSPMFSPQRFLESLRSSHLGMESLENTSSGNTGLPTGESRTMTSSLIKNYLQSRFSPSSEQSLMSDSHSDIDSQWTGVHGKKVATRKKLDSPTSAFLPLSEQSKSHSTQQRHASKSISKQSITSKATVKKRPPVKTKPSTIPVRQKQQQDKISESGSVEGVDIAEAIARANEIFNKHNGVSAAPVDDTAGESVASSSGQLDLSNHDQCASSGGNCSQKYLDISPLSEHCQNHDVGKNESQCSEYNGEDTYESYYQSNHDGEHECSYDEPSTYNGGNDYDESDEVSEITCEVHRKGGVNDSIEYPDESESLHKPRLLWQILEDPASGRYYYHNRLTDETQWERPMEEEMNMTYINGEIIHSETGNENNCTAEDNDVHDRPVEILQDNTSICVEDNFTDERKSAGPSHEECNDDSTVDRGKKLISSDSSQASTCASADVCIGSSCVETSASEVLSESECVSEVPTTSGLDKSSDVSCATSTLSVPVVADETSKAEDSKPVRRRSLFAMKAAQRLALSAVSTNIPPSQVSDSDNEIAPRSSFAAAAAGHLRRASSHDHAEIGELSHLDNEGPPICAGSTFAVSPPKECEDEGKVNAAAALALADSILKRHNLHSGEPAESGSSMDNSGSLDPPKNGTVLPTVQVSSGESGPKKSKRKKKTLWRIVSTDSASAPYYYNRKTKESTWTRPSDEELELLYECD